jgi:hypothetical protein
MRDFKWSDAEKKVARQAFDGALKKEYAAVLDRLKALVAKAEHPEDMWAICDYLSEQRRMIDAKYDYRYSQLIVVFGTLLREKWIDDKGLEGLGEEKLQAIHRIAAF